MDGYNGIPVFYDYRNACNSRFKPSIVHTRDTALAWYMQRYLIQKVISCYKFSGMPENWAENYFQYVLFCLGYIAVIRTDKYGIIPQHGILAGRNVMYQPTKIVIANPLLRGITEPLINEECALIQMQPDYGGIWDLVQYYADMMALSAEAAAQNLLNSKLAYVFASNNKAAAETFKKMTDSILSGEPAVFVDKDLFDEDGKPRWVMFNQNLKQTYVADVILEDLTKWDARFNTDIGIPNVNVAKESGVSADEVRANNVDTSAKINLWLETIRKGLYKANDMFDLNMNVELRFKNQMEGRNNNGIIEYSRVV